MKIRFLTIAETEVDEAVSWYQETITRVVIVVAHQSREPRYWADRITFG